MDLTELKRAPHKAVEYTLGPRDLDFAACIADGSPIDCVELSANDPL